MAGKARQWGNMLAKSTLLSLLRCGLRLQLRMRDVLVHRALTGERVVDVGIYHVTSNVCAETRGTPLAGRRELGD